MIMAENTVKNAWVVTLDYVLRDDSQEILESSEQESASMMYLQGGHEMPEGFQKALAGHQTGESFSFVLTPDKGWGERFDEAVAEVSAEDLGLEVEVGDVVEAENGDGEIVDFEVSEVREDGSVLLDGNHPLAGQTTTWEVKLVELREALPGEIEAGEVESLDDDED
jgi:FKBP-type peptidyl-prolyl cis-trans isomerase SlyD